MDWQAVGAVGSAMAGLTAVILLIVGALRGFRNLTRRFDRQDIDLGIIKHELFANSGESLRDQLDKTRADVNRLHERMDNLEAHQKGKKKRKWGDWS